MEHLTPEQLEEIRRELERATTRLQRSMRSSEQAARPVELDQTAVGRLSRIDALQNQSMSQELRERERSRLAQLQGALQRLEEGSYGVCAGCEQPIAFGRLLIFPETRNCARCASGK